jgi:hypothetical protein
MASDATITAALRAAALDGMDAAERHFASTYSDVLPMPGLGATSRAARTIAAFLRALPDLSVCPRGVCKHNGAFDAESLAAAVEAAAHE